jgi:hypothetical protein
MSRGYSVINVDGAVKKTRSGLIPNLLALIAHLRVTTIDVKMVVFQCPRVA